MHKLLQKGEKKKKKNERFIRVKRLQVRMSEKKSAHNISIYVDGDVKWKVDKKGEDKEK